MAKETYAFDPTDTNPDERERGIMVTKDSIAHRSIKMFEEELQRFEQEKVQIEKRIDDRKDGIIEAKKQLGITI